MAFIVIDKSTSGQWEHAAIVTNEEGAIKVFDSLKEAWKEADDCQDGIVVGDEIVNVDIDEKEFVSTFRDNIKLLQGYMHGLIDVPKEASTALNNLIKLKDQIVA